MNLFVLPVAHMLLYGVIRDINRFIIESPKKKTKYALSGDDKRLISSREKGTYSSTDFPHAYKDIIVNHKHWKLADWVHWCDVHSRVIMRGICIGDDPVFTELYHKVHRAAVYFVKSHLGQSAPGEHETLIQHAAAFRAYATYVEAFVSKELCKSNLH